MKIEAKITSIVVKPKLKAVATVVIDDEIVIKGFKVIDGVNGRFVAMPSQRIKNGGFAYMCFFRHKETKAQIEKAIFAEYERQMAKLHEKDNG